MKIRRHESGVKEKGHKKWWNHWVANKWIPCNAKIIELEKKKKKLTNTLTNK